jgi:hypothetical protein
MTAAAAIANETKREDAEPIETINDMICTRAKVAAQYGVGLC